MKKIEKLTRFEGWLVVVMVIVVFGGMGWGYWNISPLALLVAIGIISYPLWVYWRKVCSSCEHTNCPLNPNRSSPTASNSRLKETINRQILCTSFSLNVICSLRADYGKNNKERFFTSGT